MKKILSVLICITILLSAVPMISHAKAVTNPVFADFEDYTSGTSYENGYVSLSLKANETEVLDEEHGKSIKLYNPLDVNKNGEKDKDNYINFQSTLNKDAVFGFSCLTYDSKGGFAIASKGLGNVWGESAVSGLFTLDGKNIKIGTETVRNYEPGTWLDVVLAMDYSGHKVYAYVNGELVSTYSLKDAVKGTEYFNMNIWRNRYSDMENAKENHDPAAIYFDNIFVYYPPESVTSSVSGNMVDSKTIDEITVSFGQNVLVDDFSAAATLNGEVVETEPVVEHGYVTGLKLKNLSLSGDTKYQIAFVGVTDFLGDAIEATCSFETASTDPVVSIECDDADSVYPADTKVTFKITSANLEGNPIVIYNNDEIVTTLLPDAKEFSVVLTGGTNNIYAEVPALDLKTEVISIEAEAYGVIGEAKFIDFEDGTTSGLQSASPGKAKHGVVKVQKSDEEHGNSLYFEFDGTLYDAGVVDDRPFILVETVTGKYGTYIYEADFNFSQVETAGNFFSLKTDNNKWNSMFTMSNGDIKLTFGNKETIYSGLEANTWVKLKASWDIEAKTADFYVDDVLVANDIPMPNKDFDSIQYINMGLNTKKDEKVSMYMDNIKTCFIAKMANVEADFGESGLQEVPYENAVINLTFDQTMNPETLKGIKFTDEDGSELSADFTADNNMNFTATIASFKPNMNYIVDLSGVLTELGVGLNNTSVSFKTAKLPFAIKNADVSELGSKVNVDVNIQNLNAEEKSYIVIAGLYDGNKMVGSDAKSFTSASSEKAELSVNKPSGDYKIEIYVFDSAQALNLIDKLIIE